MIHNRLRELSHEILSAITATPSLIPIAELKPDDFPEGRLRETFKAIDAEWQDSGSGVINPGRLANRLGPNVDAVFLGSLFDGAIVIKPEVFLDLVADLRKKAGGLRIAEKIGRQATSPAGVDEAEIRKDYDELDRLNQGGGAGEKNGPAPCLMRPAFTGMLSDFLNADLPEAEILIEGLLSREEFLYVGGVKHSHKTSLLMGLGLHFAAGKTPWLNFTIPKPGRFLMVQQELGEWEWRKRLRAAILYGGFDPSVLERFFTYTGTGNPIKVMTDRGFARLEALVKEFCPDILALDPQASFCVGKENDNQAQALLRDRLNYLKIKYNLGLALSHHFSSKRPAGDPTAPTELAGWFRGHTILSDAADAQLGLHRLPGQRTNPNLPRAYENYNQVEVNLRNGKWPPKFAIEFDEEAFLMRMSDVWKEAGFRIPVGNVREVCDAHGGSILLADLILYYVAEIGEISAPTVKSAVNRDVAAHLVETERIKGKGSPILVKSKERKP
jgi:hypothetical protein